MSDPREVVRHDDNHARYETYAIDNSTITYDAAQPGGSAVVGRAVTLSTDDTVALAADGDVVHGKLILVEVGLRCTVQIGGFCELPGGNGATLTVQTKILGALNASSAPGFIKSAPESTAADAVKVAKTRGLIVNNNVTTAVVVDLG